MKNIPQHKQLKTAVLFLVFNRLDVTKKVFNAIREAKPPRLYIAADGARSSKAGEAEKTTAVRDFILKSIDWECEVKTLFREVNLGCKYAVSGAIDWFFDQEEMGIILEDDCLPSQSFFWFCEELLERYKDDRRIMMVSGYNKVQNHNLEHSYFFSNIGGIWGWASWSRAWAYYEVDPVRLQELYQHDFYKLGFLLGHSIYKKRKEHFSSLLKGLDTWDYQWSFARHFNSGLSCVATRSLVANIGFGKDATHTKNGYDEVTNSEIVFPLSDNKVVIADRGYDKKIHAKIGMLHKVKILIKGVKNFFKK